ncbi:hypothetical protein cypCar_00045754 [Cyprinus carpio]|nr:hypothetical protein cypCar_00045754 [Cyprinus carpio]
MKANTGCCDVWSVWVVVCECLSVRVRVLVCSDRVNSGEGLWRTGHSLPACSFKSRELISSSSSVTWSFLPEGEAGAFASGLFSESEYNVSLLQIFYYTGGKQFPGSVPQFKSRVEWAGDMNKMDASIRVIQMQFKDNGTFSCDVKNPPDISGLMSFTKVRVVLSDPGPETEVRVLPSTYFCLKGI